MEDQTNYRSDGEEPKQNFHNDPIRGIESFAHDNKIQELIDHIDILESKLKIMSEQKNKIISQLKNFEEENEMLKEQISRQNESNKKLNFDRNKFEKQIQELQISNKTFNENVKAKFEILNKELEDKETIVEKLNQQLKAKEETIKYFTINNEKAQRYSNTYKDELQEQKLINKKQIDKISELEKQIDQLYIQKQSEGSLLLEIEHLKDDNMRLLQMLKSTAEFKDFAFLSETVPGGIRFHNEPQPPLVKGTPATSQNVPSQSVGSKTSGNQKKINDKSNNNNNKDMNSDNWIPSEALICAKQFKSENNLDLNETMLNNLLTSLNKVWQEREKQQINRLKAKYRNEITSLKRKVTMKSGFDEYTAQKTISKLKKDLKQTKEDLRDNIALNNKLKTSPVGIELVDNALKIASTFQNTKACLENEIENLKKQLAHKDEKNLGTQQYYNQGCYWMAKKANEEIELLDKTVDELYSEYEERVRKSNIMNNKNDLMDYNFRVVNNSVKWFFSTLKEIIANIKEKFNNWKNDTQNSLDILKLNVKMK